MIATLLTPQTRKLIEVHVEVVEILVADLFCGAGGSSEGARRALEALGFKMKLVAVDHWNRAIETHSTMHPEAAHFCVDVFKTEPRDAVPGGKLDLLMASPTCVYHSRARGGKPVSWDQRYGRMTPSQVVRWLRELDVACLLVENVAEFMDWTKVHYEERPPQGRCKRKGKCQPGKPCRISKGMYFRAWVREIKALGYTVEWRILKAADYGDATTRERFFLLARKDGKPIVWPESTHSKTGDADLFGSGKKKWRAAREVIDWSIKGKSIFDRKKPLSPKTLARIEAGAVKLGWPEPFLVVLRQHMYGQSIDAPLPTVCAGGNHLALAERVPSPFVQGNRAHNVAKPDEPLATQPTANRHALIEPFVLSQAQGGIARSVEQPVPAICTDGAHALVAPYYGQSIARTVDRPLPTTTTKDRFGLVMPVTHDDTSSRARDLDQPMPTVTAAPRGELAFVTASFGERVGQSPRVHMIDEPVPTILAEGSTRLVEPVKGQQREYDILFRMLEPHELAAAMGFDRGEQKYEFSGTKTEITRQIGNAVCVNQAAALVRSVFGGR